MSASPRATTPRPSAPRSTSWRPTARAAAGIKEGDSILMVDGDDLEHVGFRRFRALMEGKVGSTVRLAVSHNGALKRVELKRVSLVNVGPADAAPKAP